MGRGGNNSQQQEINDFVKGKTDHLSLQVEPDKKLGFSPAQATASGAGSHGGTHRQKNKRDRQQTKKELRDYQ